MIAMRTQFPLLLLLSLYSGLVLANVGLPILSYYAGYSILLFIPIVGIESFVLKTRAQIAVLGAIGVMMFANLTSTAAGLLVAAASFLIPLAPPEGTLADLITLVLLIPFCYLSIWIEARVARWRLSNIDRKILWKSIRLANVASYSMFAVFIISRIIKGRIVNGYFF